MNKSIRTLALAAMFAVTLGVSGVVAAQPPRPVAVQAATPTPIDSSAPVKLELGKPFETYFDGQDLYSAYFQFSGKANQLVEVMLEKTKGSFGVTVYVASQNDVELADIHSAFFDSASVTVKLPQDGNYKIQIQADKPGAGDLEPGTVKVTVNEKKKATPAAAATAVVTTAATAAK